MGKVVGIGAAIAVVLSLAIYEMVGSGAPPSRPPSPATSPASPSATPVVPGTPAATPSRPPATAEPASPQTSCGRGKVFRYRVLVEDGLGTTASGFARSVAAVLCDPRGWTRSGHVRFRYDPDGPYLISLRSARGTERECSRYLGRPAGSYYSCAGPAGAVLNANRWFGGSVHWPGPLADYRRMVVNHEVGHVLGMRHRSCPGRGERAPVMMQQSKGLKSCTRNSWPSASELRALPYGR